MAYSGKFIPRNPAKYVGDYHNIIYRSSWERKVMTWLDTHSEVISWNSEELVVPYISPVDSKYHRYYPDMLAKIRSKDGTVRTYMLEVKPNKQTQEPKKRKRMTQQYLQEVATYGINKAKWEAAKEYCKDRKWEFVILTEENNPWINK